MELAYLTTLGRWAINLPGSTVACMSKASLAIWSFQYLSTKFNTAFINDVEHQGGQELPTAKEKEDFEHSKQRRKLRNLLTCINWKPPLNQSAD
uniref:Uncharacterized protein n=1 Tax=Trichuris muris TaxID=70415 RepID=A0A5S6Q7V4_TRIMR